MSTAISKFKLALKTHFKWSDFNPSTKSKLRIVGFHLTFTCQISKQIIIIIRKQRWLTMSEYEAIHLWLISTNLTHSYNFECWLTLKLRDDNISDREPNPRHLLGQQSVRIKTLVNDYLHIQINTWDTFLQEHAVRHKMTWFKTSTKSKSL